MKEYIIPIPNPTNQLTFIIYDKIPNMYAELIRCKDCKFATCIEQKEDWWECKHDKRVNHSDGFCNWAERKEE